MKQSTFVVCLLMLAGCGARPSVEPRVVGTWDLQVPNPSGMSRWVWDIHANGTYEFHAEGPGSPEPHRGTLTATGGKYTLISTTIAWNDTGTYQLANDDTMVATGKLGTASWHRVESASTPLDPALSGHFTSVTLWEQSKPDDHMHRCNIDGTLFEHDTRYVAFSAKTDLTRAQLEALDIRCSVGAAAAAPRPLARSWVETSTELDLVGSVGPPDDGQWASGDYTLACETKAGPFITRSFTIK